MTEERLAVAALAAHGACSWSESMFVGALDPLRDEAARRAIVDRFYAAYAADVAAAPEGHAMDSVHCFMRVRKEA